MAVIRSKQRLHARLARQRGLIGLLQAHPHPVLSEIAGWSGYDFVMLDGEHGLFDAADYVQAVQVLSSVGALAFVRLANHDTHALGMHLDMGADVIVVPNISTADQARMLVRAMSYPPAGTRGIGASLHRATRYGRDSAAYLTDPRDGVSLIVIIESATGISNVEEILAVDGVDGAIVGPADLSADLGHPGDFSRAEYAAALARVERATELTGKVLGTAPHPGYPIEILVQRGHRLFITGSDTSLISEAMRAQVAQAKATLDAGLR
jgi:2-keto-3-deoxy-L-rhamnonate aldolase RhmA